MVAGGGQWRATLLHYGYGFRFSSISLLQSSLVAIDGGREEWVLGEWVCVTPWFSLLDFSFMGFDSRIFFSDMGFSLALRYMKMVI
jgi:hypothetical protein